jgi:hypothetical protein
VLHAEDPKNEQALEIRQAHKRIHYKEAGLLAAYWQPQRNDRAPVVNREKTAPFNAEGRRLNRP